ncbi:MAG: Double zinc ribbon, partial [Miltoncostaeaceae bacterium]|nr:Double zinc ribbon [Miltoncostaeaceae bacterium]
MPAGSGNGPVDISAEGAAIDAFAGVVSSRKNQRSAALFCASCGERLRAGAAFCAGCGQPLAAAPAAEAPTQQPETAPLTAPPLAEDASAPLAMGGMDGSPAPRGRSVLGIPLWAAGLIGALVLGGAALALALVVFGGDETRTPSAASVQRQRYVRTVRP